MSKSSNAPLNVLVLGVGGNVSQGIVKALSPVNTALKVRVVGACISANSPGLFMTDRAYVSPLAVADNFVDWVIDVCLQEKIDAILSGVEPNLTALAPQVERIREKTGAVCIVSSPEKLAIGDDKLKTCQWLDKNGFNFPRYAACSDEEAVWRLVAECGYPLIAKPRSGRGGVGIITVRNEAGVHYALTLKDYVLEELLGSDGTEYTVGCFCDKEGQLKGTIAMHRDLVSGTTSRAQVGEFPEVRAEAARIARALKPTGPLNVQMRIHNGKPVSFELNVRYSGTTPIRARFGWNDVEEGLRHYVLDQPARNLPEITSGHALRYWDEIYVDERAQTTLNHTGVLDSPRKYDLTHC